MNEDALNMSIRKFLKKVGIASQREIEQAVRDALANGSINSGDVINVSMTLNVDKLDIQHQIQGEIDLE